MQSLDTAYPSLAELAGLSKSSLDALARSSKDHRKYLTFADACLMACAPDIRHSHADAIDYLRTLDIVLTKHPLATSKAKKAYWKRLTTMNGSQFLDTVCETT